MRARWRSALWAEGVFLVAFVALALVRALNPDLWHPVWGGEKPMEFGFLNAILRSPVLPPYDPFFSGGYINYYYYGLYLISLPIKATGIAPAVGFNLGMATVFGLTMVGAFTLVRELTRRTRYGLLAVALVGIIGNLSGFFATGWSRGFNAVLTALRAGGLAGFGERLGDWYIGPSRVIPNTINEFPAFSFLFADLHAHVIALPITLLVVALGYGLVTASRRGQATQPRAPQVAPLLLLALALGALAVTNSWDFPTYGLLTGLALLGAAWRTGGPRARGVPWGGLTRAALLALGVGLGALALYAPFFDRYWAPVGGLGAVHLADGTTLSDYLLIYGLFAAILLPVLVGWLWWLPPHRGVVGTPPLPELGRSRAPIVGRKTWRFLLVLAALLVTAVAVPTIGLRLVLVMLLLAGLVLLRRRQISAPAWYALLLTWVALAVSLGFELVYIRDHLDGSDWYRMNTVFKFGLQAWVLLALAAAASLPLLLHSLRRIGGQMAQWAGLFVLALLLALASVYPLAAVPARIANRITTTGGPTLDGLAFMRQGSFTYACDAFGGCENGASQVTIDLSGDAEAIHWLNAKLTGTPIVVQSSLGFYRAYGIRIAANTGLPTVISALHENEQRASDAAARREADVTNFYTSSEVEPALRFLARYDVNYVYVGGVEHAVYPAAGLAKFDQMRGLYLTPVFDTPQVQIYAVTNVPPSYARPEAVNFTAPAPISAAQREPIDQTPPGLAAREAANQANPTDGPTAFGLAERYRDMGRLDDAARVLAPAARANPTDIGVLHLWGDILTQAKRYDEAEQAYQRAANAQPSADNWNKLGTALLEWGKFKQAEIALNLAVAADGLAPDPHYQLGRLFAQTGNTDQAKMELQTYLDLAPDGQWSDAAWLLFTQLGGRQ